MWQKSENHCQLTSTWELGTSLALALSSQLIILDTSSSPTLPLFILAGARGNPCSVFLVSLVGRALVSSFLLFLCWTIANIQLEQGETKQSPTSLASLLVCLPVAKRFFYLKIWTSWLVLLCPSQVLPFLPLQFPNHSVARNICNPLSGIVIFGTTDCWRAFADCRGGSSYLFPWWLSRTGPTMGIGDIAIAVNYFQSILARPCSPKSPLYPVSCSFGILVQLTLFFSTLVKRSFF